MYWSSFGLDRFTDYLKRIQKYTLRVSKWAMASRTFFKHTLGMSAAKTGYSKGRYEHAPSLKSPFSVILNSDQCRSVLSISALLLDLSGLRR